MRTKKSVSCECSYLASAFLLHFQQAHRASLLKQRPNQDNPLYIFLWTFLYYWIIYGEIIQETWFRCASKTSEVNYKVCSILQIIMTAQLFINLLLNHCRAFLGSNINIVHGDIFYIFFLFPLYTFFSPTNQN